MIAVPVFVIATAILIHDVPSTPWEIAARNRADAIFSISWTAKADGMPTQKEGQFFREGESYSGIPYSSLWDRGNNSAFVGNEVSFYTFLSAVNNPGSKVYSADYHKINPKPDKNRAGCHYGSVCSTTADYILGYPYIFTTTQICRGYVPALTDLGTDFEDLHLFDAPCANCKVFTEPTEKQTNHVMVIYDIARDRKGAVRKVTIEEAWGSNLGEGLAGTRRVTYSFEEFKAFMARYGYHLFRVDQSRFCYHLPSFVEQSPSFDCTFPEDLCLADGDRRTYSVAGKGDNTCQVEVNVLSDKYDMLVVRRNGIEYQRQTVTRPGTVILSGLPEGMYEAVLTGGTGTSAPTRFQIVGVQRISASYRDGIIYLTVPDGFEPVCVRPIYTSRYLLCSGRTQSGQYMFPFPENQLPTDRNSAFIFIRMAGEYGTYSVPGKIRYRNTNE